MRSQAIEKLAVAIIKAYQVSDMDRVENLMVKQQIVMDRDHNRSASIIKEVMNNGIV